jgi:hypothetical protein
MFCLLAAFLTAGCTAGSDDSGGPSNPTTFVAFASDFSGFRTWSSTPGVGPPGAPQPPNADGGGVHAGPLTTYINEKPPHGSTSFPVGTIIVKEPDDPPLTQRQIFAMVKRGGGYNSDGATNWEWFELANGDANDVVILWRGVGPMNGDPYASTPAICNDCHGLASKNDFVWTAGLGLSSF